METTDQKPLAKMTKPELLAEAERLGIAVPDGATNPQIVALIEAGPKVTQAEPTKPRPIDETGRALDVWGLPISGPARARRLTELNKTDPRKDPEGWGAAPAETKE